MRINKFFFLTILYAFSLFYLAGCKKPKDEDQHVVVSFSTKPFLSAGLDNTEETLIELVLLYGVDEDDQIIQTFKVQNPSSIGVVLEQVSNKIKTFYAIANPDNGLKIALDAKEPAKVDDLMGLTYNFTQAPKSPFPMSGTGEVKDFSVKIELYRAVAKVELSSNNGFKIESVLVKNIPDQTFVFKQASLKVPTTANMINYQPFNAGMAEIVTLYVAESLTESPVQFTMSGQSGGNPKNYIISLKNKEDDNDILRNNFYQAKVNLYDGIKILAIGNSYSEDVMIYLFETLRQLGMDEDIKLVNAYIDGGFLSDHANSIRANDYSSLKRETFGAAGIINESNFGAFTLRELIEQEKWDLICLQQGSRSSGKPLTYNEDLDLIIDNVRLYATNPNFKLIWHMTWAWARGYLQFGEATYPDQIPMYEAICATVQSKIKLKKDGGDFDFIIPSGTAIQNARKFFGDKMNHDGTHLNNLGSYIGSAMWIKSITGIDLTGLSTGYVANKKKGNSLPITIDAAAKSQIVKAVNDAHANPFATYP